MKSKKVSDAPILAEPRVSTQLPPSALKALDDRAEKEGRSRSNLIRIIILEALGIRS